MGKQLKALVGARVSVLKGDEKVSHLAQHETGMKYVNDHGYAVAGTFEDLDVSADKYPTFERPDLGPWLTDEAKVWQWDVIIWSKIDRAFRSTSDCVKFAEWARANKKIVVFADDGLVLDYFHPNDVMDMQAMMSELFVYLGAFFAQIELRRFKGRALDAHRVLRRTDRWAGGTPPEGYTTAPHPSGKGRTLVQDAERQKMLHESAELLLAKDLSFNAIARWLDDHGYETTKDYHRSAEKKKGTRWSAAQVIGMFTSLNTQGVKMQGQGKNNRPVLDDDGNMIQLAPATFDDATWKQIQAAVARRRYGPRKYSNGSNPLGDVVFCKCNSKARHRVTHQSYGDYRYYNCGNTLRACAGVANRAEEVEGIVEQTFLEECSDVKVKRRVFIPGEDHTEELERIKNIINRLREDRELGLYEGAEDEARFRSQMTSLINQRKSLEALPHREAGWRLEETDETYGEKWERNRDDPEERRKMLVDAGVRIVLKGKFDWEVQIPEDIKTRLTKSLTH